MATKTVKKKEHEKLTDANISKVIGLLEDKKVTKKEACEILNISYNTTRLESILTNYKEEKERIKLRRAEKRGKPFSDGEISTIIERKLIGDPMIDISSFLYRSVESIQKFVDTLGIPEKPTGEDKYKTSLLPEQCMSEDFTAGEVAWSAVHHTTCEIINKLGDTYIDKYGTPCYKVWVREKSKDDFNLGNLNSGYYAYIESYNLGKLDHLVKYGLVMKNL